MSKEQASTDRDRANARLRRTYARQARRYDRSAELWERWALVADHRAWVCSHAVGATLEVAIGTGLNLPHYPPDVRLTGIDLSPEMLEQARARACALGRPTELWEADAHELPFPDGTFDTVVCTYALCSIHDDRRAIAEMARVLAPGGRLTLLEHVASTVRPLYWLQRLLDIIESRRSGESWTRRPAMHVQAVGLDVVAGDRLRAGIVERLVAIKPTNP
jgi:ubiquinone/menaquinone biosynthesis C-methylase UbiE